MDVLYYVGSGSRHNNMELRYSLRSLEKHCKDIDKVWVVGNRPLFLRNVEYIWVEDKYKWHTNACLKTRAAIDAGISSDFLLMNNDFFMTADFTAKDYPYYHKGDMPESGDTEYKQVIANTRKYLEQNGHSFKHYGMHCPMVINAEKYKSLEKFYHEPMSIRCLYGNLFTKGRLVKDCKGDKFKSSPTKCFSSKEWMGNDFVKELDKLYPTPSKWEEADV